MEDPIKKLHEKLSNCRPKLAGLDEYWRGEQPSAFMAEKSREALGGRLSRMSVNFPRILVESLAERLTITGFKVNGSADVNTDAWDTWRHCRMPDASAQAHVDALVYGRSYAIVWADDDGRPVITVESPMQMSTLTDPLTRRVTWALKRWVDADEIGWCVLYGPDEIQVHTTGEKITDLDVWPATGWTLTEKHHNPFGVVPVVPIVNRGRLLEVDGVSELHDILGLTDALNKVMADAMVTSESYARPRRWVTGLEIMEDDDGNPMEPFSEGMKLWQSESPETKFGQFDGARLDGYSDLSNTLVQQIGAVTGLPPHYLGVYGDQPASADAIRSAEASLVSRCLALQRTFGQAWADVATLVLAVLEGASPAEFDVDTMWASAETRTPAQAADAAAKLAGVGVPLPFVLEKTLGYTPEEVAQAHTTPEAPAPIDEKETPDAA